MPLKYDQYDIRLEVRRSDAAERPRVETVARACKEHYGAVFDAALGRIREALTQESML